MRHVKHSPFLQSTAVQLMRFAAMPDAETFNNILRCTSSASSSAAEGGGRVLLKERERPRSCCAPHSQYPPAVSRLFGMLRTKVDAMRDGNINEGRMGDGELDVLEGEAQDVVQPLLAITRKCRTHADNTAKSRRLSTPQPIKSRAANHAPPIKNPSITRRLLKKAKSAPDLSNITSDYVQRRPQKRTSFQASSEEAGDLAVGQEKLDDYDDDSSVTNITGLSINPAGRKEAILGQILQTFDENQPMHAEALWDHMTLDAMELKFSAGDVIEVMDMADKHWWWGKLADKEGWFPSAFVTLRKRQSCDYIDGSQDTSDGVSSSNHSTQEAKTRMNRARSSVILDIVSSERDYVKHLKDVVEGYVEKTRKRSDMFDDLRRATIFGNIEQIYQLSSKFLKDLEKHIDQEEPSKSEIGCSFLNYETNFQIYSEYCNNHPFACDELRRLQSDRKFQHFFEACRLLQQMIEIPLEGFLLTPVQKICKYPLQLKELLKYTHIEHPDYSSLQQALEMMKKTAMFINERKRKMESLEKLTQWQKTVTYWQGPALLENSSELIYSGETNKVSITGSQRIRIVFLFDHQLIFCKKDILWREVLVYKGRIFIDNCNVYRMQEGKESKHGFKLHDHVNDIWYTFSCRNLEEEDRWLRAFDEERRRIELDRENGFDLGKFKIKAQSSNEKLHLQHPGSKAKSTRKKSLNDESPLVPPSGGPQIKKGLLGFMQRRHRR